MHYKAYIFAIIIATLLITISGCYKNTHIEIPIEPENKLEEGVNPAPSVESDSENTIYWLLPSIEYDTAYGFGFGIYNLFFPFEKYGFAVGVNLGYRHVEYHTYQSEQIAHPVDFYVFSGVVGYFFKMGNFSPGITSEVMYMLPYIKEPDGAQYDVEDGNSYDDKEAIRFTDEIGLGNRVIQKADFDNFGCRVNLWFPYQSGNHLVLGGNISWIMYPKAEFITVLPYYENTLEDGVHSVNIERNKVSIINLHAASFGLFVGGRW